MVQPVIITLDSETIVSPKEQRRMLLENIKKCFFAFKDSLCKVPCAYPLGMCTLFIGGGVLAWASSKNFIIGVEIGTALSIIGFFLGCFVNIYPVGHFRFQRFVLHRNFNKFKLY